MLLLWSNKSKRVQFTAGAQRSPVSDQGTSQEDHTTENDSISRDLNRLSVCAGGWLLKITLKFECSEQTESVLQSPQCALAVLPYTETGGEKRFLNVFWNYTHGLFAF